MICSMKNYRNYVFDLYGTLLDIRTDERSPKLWKIMKNFYNSYGCEWKKKRMRDAFFLYDAGERQRQRVLTGILQPEIRIERVFARLLFEGCPSHSCGFSISGIPVDELRERYKTDIDGVLSITEKSDWVVSVANLFRTVSRKYVRPYADTISTLNSLKKCGCRLYLLSNAQRLYTMPEIETTGLDRVLDKIYISSDYGMMKPEKEYMQILLREEGLDPKETVMVGNEIESDIAIALRCGIHSIYLNTFNYSSKETARRLNRLITGESSSEDLYPYIVSSGRIAEIL